MKIEKDDAGKDDVIYLVPHTHYDAIWVFTKEDYYYLNIDLILKKVVAFLPADQTLLTRVMKTQQNKLQLLIRSITPPHPQPTGKRKRKFSPINSPLFFDAVHP